jgi:hypothetical protein
LVHWSAWLTSIEEALTSIEFGRGERLYAIAFWLFYAETGAVMYPPAVGLGAETARREARVQTAWQDAPRTEGRDAGSTSLRWNPAGDWECDILELPTSSKRRTRPSRLKRAGCPEEARHADDDPARDARWQPHFDRTIDAVIAVSHELTRRARARIVCSPPCCSRTTSSPLYAIQVGGIPARNGFDAERAEVWMRQ